MSDAPQDMTHVEGPDPETGLIEALARGDCTLFWRYWRQQQRELLRMCMRWLGGDPHDSEDALNTGALKVIDHLYGRTVNIERFRPWLLRILRNLCIDMRRERQRSTPLATLGAGAGKFHGVLTSMSSGDRPDRHLYRRELRAALAGSVRVLPRPLQEVFVLRFVEELPSREIARRLGISDQNARKRIQQARALLQRSLEASQISIHISSSPPSYKNGRGERGRVEPERHSLPDSRGTTQTRIHKSRR